MALSASAFETARAFKTFSVKISAENVRSFRIPAGDMRRREMFAVKADARARIDVPSAVLLSSPHTAGALEALPPS